MLTVFFWLSILAAVSCQIHTDSSLLNKEKSILPPCQACTTLVKSFEQGMEKTARGKFEGGDAAWEEERLGSYAYSEVRLIEIQEKLCLTVDKGADQCHHLAEANEQAIEDWWFREQKREPSLLKYLCIETIKACCPEKHFGPDCMPCPGAPDNVCFNNGKCKGSGTRKGSGQCACDVGYSGDTCTQCASNYYESYRDDTKLLCSPCNVACQGNCNQAGPKGCAACKPGWTMDTERGCFDVNECFQEPSICQSNQFCVNSEGSYVCLACDKACKGCSGDGPDMCDECTEGYILHDNICIDGQQAQRDNQVSFTRYLTYFGLCLATCIIFQKSTVVASVIGLCVALYISVSEYMLNSESNNVKLEDFLLPSTS